jgi:chaperonin GroES
MNVIPLDDRIIVRPSDAALCHRRRNEIVGPTDEEPQCGVVIAAGTGAVDGECRTIPFAVQAGDTILFGRHLGCEVTFAGTQYWMMKADDIVKIEARAIIVALSNPRLSRRARHAA